MRQWGLDCFPDLGKGNRSSHSWSRLWLRASGKTDHVGTDAAAGCRHACRHLVGYDTLNAAGERLLADEIFNTVLVLLVVSSLLGPILTELFTPGMVRQEARTTPASA